MDFIKYDRKHATKTDMDPFVVIRSNVIAFNVRFVSRAALKENRYVTFFGAPKEFCVGFKFSATPVPGSYALTTDGGNKKSGGLCVGAQSFMKQNPWVPAVARNHEHPEMCRFKPEWDGIQGLWVIKLYPSFELTVSHRSEIPLDARGIYRYKHGDEIVYIGRGQIRSRLTAPEREDWDFETIEYSVIPNTAQQEHWEAWWLDRFVRENGKVPRYNRILGKRSQNETA